MSSLGTHVACVVCLGLTLLPVRTSPAAAQEHLSAGGSGPTLFVDISKPSLDGRLLTRDTRGAAVVDMQLDVPLGAHISLFGGIGLSRAVVDSVGATNVLSKPRVGILVGGDGAVYFQAHIDVPRGVGSDDGDAAVTIGALSDLERQERFLRDEWSIGWFVAGEKVVGSGVRAGARAGSTMVIPRNGGTSVRYGLLSGFATLPTRGVDMGAELSAVALLGDGWTDFASSTLFYATVSAGLSEVPGKPELYLRLPVDADARHGSVVDAVIGLRLWLGG